MEITFWLGISKKGTFKLSPKELGRGSLAQEWGVAGGGIPWRGNGVHKPLGLGWMWFSVSAGKVQYDWDSPGGPVAKTPGGLGSTPVRDRDPTCSNWELERRN